jgi:hypothetical protein
MPGQHIEWTVTISEQAVQSRNDRPDSDSSARVLHRAPRSSVKSTACHVGLLYLYSVPYPT